MEHAHRRDDDGQMDAGVRELAGRLQRVAVAIEYGVDRLRKAGHVASASPQRQNIRPGVVRRSMAARAAIQREAGDLVARTLSSAHRELERMSELLVQVHRLLLAAPRSPQKLD